MPFTECHARTTKCHALIPLLLAVVVPLDAQEPSHWPAYGLDLAGSRYSPLGQIHRGNVTHLEIAWTYRTGELGQGANDARKLTFEATPIHFEGVLYLSTAFGMVIALDPSTGRERWIFDPGVDRSQSYSEVTSRGVAAWRDPEAPATAECAARILIGTIDARLIAVDATRGQPCRSFGRAGQIDLALAVGMQGEGDYQVTSPPIVTDGVVIVGSSIGDNWNVDTGRGVVRAFDARTGEPRWAWDPIPRDSTGFRAGAANAWSVMTVDPERDLVFVPTSSPSPDFYGGLRPGDNRYANSVVALRASTGQVVWHFQTVHHDLWDYDVAAQPVLVTVERGGRRIPAVVQATKMGSLFVLDRETGDPLFPIEERPVPRSDVAGERAWPTQPFPTIPRPLVPHRTITAADAWGLTPADLAECRAVIAAARSEGIFTPPSVRGTIMFPGNSGGNNWGSVAFHPGRQLIVANTNRLATLVELIPRDSFASVRARGGPFEYAAQRGAPFGMRRRTFRSSSGLPCTPPPWGTLAAVDLSTGAIAWEIPFGTTPPGFHLPADVTDTMLGWPSGGGAIVTGGDLVFIGASMDQKLRAYDIATGTELWSAPLPRAAIATPMTYLDGRGRQYVVIAAGGQGKWGIPTGDYLVAFALPGGP